MVVEPDGDVTISGEGLQNFLSLWSWGQLTCICSAPDKAFEQGLVDIYRVTRSLGFCRLILGNAPCLVALYRFTTSKKYVQVIDS